MKRQLWKVAALVVALVGVGTFLYIQNEADEVPIARAGGLSR
jgi:hypothetical protein